MSTISPCHCDVYNTKEFDNALFLNKRLSDMTINFPSHNISFPAHRLMMAKTSPYFETLFYGPMAIKDQEWKVKDNDIDPEVFKIVLAHLYNLNLLDESLEMTLCVYKLADCYMIDSLKFQCLRHVRNIISKDMAISEWNYQNILEWTKEYDFNDIKVEVLEGFSTSLCQYDPEMDVFSHDELHENFSILLLNSPLETHQELLNLCEHIKLRFKESWRHPENPLSSEMFISIFESTSHKAKIISIQGCFSPQAFNKTVNCELYLSIIDNLHSQALYEGFKDIDFGFNQLNLHIPCNIISSEELAIWSSKVNALYLSNVDDQHVHWAISSILSIKPYALYFPRCRLTLNGFKTLRVRWRESACCPNLR